MTKDAYTTDDLAKRAPLALLFHENSKITRASRDWLAESISEFTDSDTELRKSLTGTKTYPGADRILLPPRHELPYPQGSLADLLQRRRSVRELTEQPIPLRLIGSLLEHACGVTARMDVALDGGDLTQSLRAAPSGGALYPIEIYLVVWPNDGGPASTTATLRPGVYHFHPVDRCLEIVRSELPREVLEQLVFTSTNRMDAPAMIVLTGRWQRPLIKYGERGYRILWLDAGHLAQNLMLVATSLGLATCPIAGFQDDALAAELGINSREEPVLYLLTVGFPQSPLPMGGRGDKQV